MAIAVESIPAEIKAIPQWVAWKYEVRPGNPKPTKVPYVPESICAPYFDEVWARQVTPAPRRASSTDPKTWATFSDAVKAFDTGLCSGIGLVITPSIGIIGVDLDNVVADDGTIDPTALEIVRTLDSYTEISPSGHGLRVFVKGRFQEGWSNKKGCYEVYGSGRFLTVTGRRLDVASPNVESRQDELIEFQFRIFGEESRVDEAPTLPLTVLSMDDQEVLKRARGTANGSKFDSLMSGAWEKTHKSQSEGDLALCSMLAFWTQDANQIDRIFRSSGLWRDKWDEKRPGGTYGSDTIARALKRDTFYDPRRCLPAETKTVNEAQEEAINVVPFPDPPRMEAYHGVAGDLVALVDPHTEADPVAILVQFLIGFGNLAGHAAFFETDGSEQHMNEDACMVGATSKGRKGTSLSHVKRVFQAIDPEWVGTRWAEGLSSGEGLINPVRDKIVKNVTGKDGTVTEVVVDEGEVDKRLFVAEGEFARALSVISREGNTLSSVIRSAWDSGSIRSMTKNSQLKTTGAHISIVGHVTRGELLKLLTKTDAANGFGNRFLWICVKRSKCLPDGGSLEPGALQVITNRVAHAVNHAIRTFKMTRSEEARELWHKVYPALSEGKAGLMGAMIGRAEAHAVRLSCLYALLDCSNVVRREHLEAALALLDYVERSARWIFGDSMGDPVAERILHELRARPEGLTRTQISVDVFRRNAKASEIKQALEALLSAGLIRRDTVPTATKPAEKWMAL